MKVSYEASGNNYLRVLLVGWGGHSCLSLLNLSILYVGSYTPEQLKGSLPWGTRRACVHFGGLFQSHFLWFYYSFLKFYQMLAD